MLHYRAPDKMLHSLDSTGVISSPNPLFDNFKESSHRDESFKWSNIVLNEEIGSIEISTHLRNKSGPQVHAFVVDLCN